MIEVQRVSAGKNRAQLSVTADYARSCAKQRQRRPARAQQQKHRDEQITPGCCRKPSAACLGQLRLYWGG